jgi:type IV pilus assembly protein PilQ
MMESEAKGKVISSPKIITKNNVPASITQNESVYFAETSSSGGEEATVTTTFKDQSAKLELNVTPQVTNDGSISLDLNIIKDTFLLSTLGANAPKDLVKRTVKTQVLVDNGSTVVLGGIYSYQHDESHSGVPFLKDIPLIGWLFRTRYNPSTNKKELIIFITPRIINQEEAGLVDSRG